MFKESIKNRGLFIYVGFFSLLCITLLVFAFLTHTQVPRKVNGIGMLLVKGEVREIISPYKGRVARIYKEEGDIINEGEIVFTLSPNGKEKTVKVKSSKKGVLAEIVAFVGTSVKKGSTLAIITEKGDVKKDLEVLGFVSSLDGKKIHQAQNALVMPTITDEYMHGAIKAKVKKVSKLPLSKKALISLLKIEELAKFFRKQLKAEPYLVRLDLKHDQDHITGYEWTKNGPNFELDFGVIVSFQVIYERERAIKFIFPNFYKNIRKLYGLLSGIIKNKLDGAQNALALY